jgi:hypothetical protein
VEEVKAEWQHRWSGKGKRKRPSRQNRAGSRGAFGSAPKPTNLRFRAGDSMAPSNPFTVLAQVRVLIGGGFSPGTVNRWLVYSFWPLEGTARDALTLPVLSIRPCLVEGLK